MDNFSVALAARCDDNTDSLTAAKWLQPEELARYRHFKVAGAAADFLSGRILAKTIAGRLLKQPPTNVIISPDRFGRPVLAEPTGFFLSISHSAGWIAAAVHRHPFFGIDIEAENRLGDVRSIAPQICTQTELSLLEDQEFDPAVFLRLWTGKEAFLKALGRGFGIDPRTVAVSILDDNTANVSLIEGETRASQITFLPSTDDILLAVITPDSSRTFTVDTYELNGGVALVKCQAAEELCRTGEPISLPSTAVARRR